MLPPTIAHLAARAKAADSLGLRYTDVTVTALEGAVTEATVLVDELDAAKASAGQGATREIDLRVERDQAREVVAALLLGIELHVGFDAIKSVNVREFPAWATPWLDAERAAAKVEA